MKRLSSSGPVFAALAAGVIALVAAGGFAVASWLGGSGDSATAGSRGDVAVLYAGSLTALLERDVGPAFQRATGYGFTGYGGGSDELAAEIRDGVRRGDVFVSASPSADVALEGAARGGWVSWCSRFASSPLVLGYDPRSRFGAELRRGVPWYRVILQKGVLVGRSDPKLDPKGRLTVEAIDEAAGALHDQALRAALGSFAVFPETELVGRLQAGQIDAGFFYAVEASAAHFPYVSLTPARKAAGYTVTVLDRAPEEAGAEAFVRYLIGLERTGTWRSEGLTPLRPVLVGKRSAVPAGLRSTVGTG